MGIKKESWTEAKIRALRPPAKDQLYGLGDGLYLRHRTTGKLTFVERRTVAGKVATTTIGDWPQWTIQRAKARALAPTQALSGRLTFGQAAERFIAEMIEPRYRGDTSKYAAVFIRDGATLWAKPLHMVTRAQLVDLLRKKNATAPSYARKMLSLYKQFSRWATLHDLMPADLLAPVRPQNIGFSPPQSRDRTLTDDEIRIVLAGVGEWWPLMRFCLLTGCRIGEALQISAEQMAGQAWTIPITKNGKAHTLWLTDSAQAALAEGWPAAHYATINRWVAKQGDWRPHDLRRTAATRMREAGVSIEDIEAVLNHSTGSALVQVYQRPDKLPAIKAALTKLEIALNVFK